MYKRLESMYQFWYNIDMDKKKINATFYRTRSGSEPVREWLKTLPSDDRRKIGEDVKTVEFGWPIGMPMVEKIERNLWEVRTNGLSFGIARIMFTVKGCYMILIHGFVKKSNKIEKEDLELSRKRLSEIYKND